MLASAEGKRTVVTLPRATTRAIVAEMRRYIDVNEDGTASYNTPFANDKVIAKHFKVPTRVVSNLRNYHFGTFYKKPPKPAPVPDEPAPTPVTAEEAPKPKKNGAGNVYKDMKEAMEAFSKQFEDQPHTTGVDTSDFVSALDILNEKVNRVIKQNSYLCVKVSEICQSLNIQDTYRGKPRR